MEGNLRKSRRWIGASLAGLAAITFAALPGGVAHADTQLEPAVSDGPVIVGPEDGPQAVFSTDTIVSGGRVAVAVVYTNPTTHPVNASVLFVTDATGTAPVFVESCETAPGDACSFNNEQLTFEVLMVDIPAGARRTADVIIRANSAAPTGDYPIFVSSNTSEFPAPDTREFTLHVVPASSDLSLSMTANPQGEITDHVNVTAVVTNNGPSDLTSATVTVVLPAGVFGIANPACDYDLVTRRYDCHVGAISAGATASVTFGAEALGLPLVPGTFAFLGVVTSGGPPDSNAANDSAADLCTALSPWVMVC